MLILRIAEKFGRSPAEVESWEPYWLNRAAIYIAAQDELDKPVTKPEPRSKALRRR